MMAFGAFSSLPLLVEECSWRNSAVGVKGAVIAHQTKTKCMVLLLRLESLKLSPRFRNDTPFLTDIRLEHTMWNLENLDLRLPHKTGYSMGMRQGIILVTSSNVEVKAYDTTFERQRILQIAEPISYQLGWWWLPSYLRIIR